MSVSGLSSSISAIGSPSPGASRVGLEAQLNRLKQQLSSCENCESAKSQSGKSNIQDINNQIGTTEARLSQLERANTAENEASNVAPNSDVRKVADVAATESNNPAPSSNVGTLLDDFA